MARRYREKAQRLEERIREAAASQVESVFAAMSPEDLAVLLFPPEGRTRAELGAAFAAHGLCEALLEAAVGPDGMRDRALRKVRMEDLVRWTVWPRASEIRAARARLEVEGRPIGKPAWDIGRKTEQAYREAAGRSGIDEETGEHEGLSE